MGVSIVSRGRAVNRIRLHTGIAHGLHESRATLGGDAADDVDGAWAAANAVTTVMPVLMMPAFSNAISPSVVAQMLLMVEPDRGDGAGHGGNDVGGVEPAAEAHLDDRNLGSGAPEQLEGDGGGGLEEGRQDAQYLAGHQAVREVEHVVRDGVEGGGVHGGVADDEPFGDVGQVGRRVAGRAQAGRAQCRVHHGRDRPFAVGAGDVQRGEAALGVAERLAQPRPRLAEPDIVPVASVEDADDVEREEPALLGGTLRTSGSSDAGPTKSLSPRLTESCSAVVAESAISRPVTADPSPNGGSTGPAASVGASPSTMSTCSPASSR